MSYFADADEMVEELGVPLLLRTDPDPRFLQRHDRISGYAVEMAHAGRLYHRLREVAATIVGPGDLLGKTVWVTGPSGSLEHLPWAIGLADQVARSGWTAFLSEREKGGVLRSLLPRSGTFPQVRLPEAEAILGSSLMAVATDLEGVRLLFPVPPGTVGSASPQIVRRWSLILAESLPETLEGPYSNGEELVGVVLVVGFRDHSPSSLIAACDGLRAAANRLLGIVAIGPEKSPDSPRERQRAPSLAARSTMLPLTPARSSAVPPATPAPVVPAATPAPAVPPAIPAPLVPAATPAPVISVPAAAAASESPPVVPSPSGAWSSFSASVDVPLTVVPEPEITPPRNEVPEPPAVVAEVPPTPAQILPAPVSSGPAESSEPPEPSQPSEPSEPSELSELSELSEPSEPSELKTVPLLASWHRTKTRSERVRRGISVAVLIALLGVLAGLIYVRVLRQRFEALRAPQGSETAMDDSLSGGPANPSSPRSASLGPDTSASRAEDALAPDADRVGTGTGPETEPGIEPGMKPGLERGTGTPPIGAVSTPDASLVADSLRRAAWTLRPSDSFLEPQEDSAKATPGAGDAPPERSPVPPDSFRSRRETGGIDPDADKGSLSRQSGRYAPEKPDSFVVHLSSFRLLNEALAEIAGYHGKGIQARYLRVPIPGQGTWYRVITGRFASFAQAESAGREMLASGRVLNAHVISGGGWGEPIPVVGANSGR